MGVWGAVYKKKITQLKEHFFHGLSTYNQNLHSLVIS